MNKVKSPFWNNGVGRRKSAVARVWLKAGTGKVVVNGKDYDTYFTTDVMHAAILMPLQVCNATKQYDAKIIVNGGGLQGQAEAACLGISRALLATNESLRVLLRANGLLTVDARIKERKKYGQKAARRKFQFVKR